MRMLHSCDWSETVPLLQQRHVSQFKTRRDGSQFTQPVRIFFGYTPRQKADSETQLCVGIATTLPAPDPARAGKAAGSQRKLPGVLIGPVRPRRSGMGHAAYFSRGGLTAVLVNRLKTVFVRIAGLSRPRLPTFMNSGESVIGVQTIVATGRLARADPAA
jgi:hypothetical protein